MQVRWGNMGLLWSWCFKLYRFSLKNDEMLRLPFNMGPGKSKCPCEEGEECPWLETILMRIVKISKDE